MFYIQYIDTFDKNLDIKKRKKERKKNIARQCYNGPTRPLKISKKAYNEI